MRVAAACAFPEWTELPFCRFSPISTSFLLKCERPVAIPCTTLHCSLSAIFFAFLGSLQTHQARRQDPDLCEAEGRAHGQVRPTSATVAAALPACRSYAQGFATHGLCAHVQAARPQAVALPMFGANVFAWCFFISWQSGAGVQCFFSQCYTVQAPAT